MNLNSLLAPTRPSKSQLTLLLLFCVAAFLAAACTRNDNTNTSTTTATQTSPSPSPSPSPPDPGDKPIILTGGSLEIDFDHTRDYRRNPAEGTTFIGASNKIGTILIFDDDRDTSPSTIVIEDIPDGEEIVEIWGKTTGDSQIIFEIKNTRDSDSVIIDFKSAEFTPDGTRRHGRSRKHFKRQFKLDEVKLKDNNNNFTPLLTNDRCSNKNKCTIEISGRP